MEKMEDLHEIPDSEAKVLRFAQEIFNYSRFSHQVVELDGKGKGTSLRNGTSTMLLFINDYYFKIVIL